MKHAFRLGQRDPASRSQLLADLHLALPLEGAKDTAARGVDHGDLVLRRLGQGGHDARVGLSEPGAEDGDVHLAPLVPAPEQRAAAQIAREQQREASASLIAQVEAAAKAAEAAEAAAASLAAERTEAQA